MEKAAFRINSYQFTKASFNFNVPEKAELTISFRPEGTFHTGEARYELSFDVAVDCKETETRVVGVSCVASFTFDGCLSFDEIPDYFYPNSLAILFPYVRAFVGTLSLQANVQPIMLPTINLMGLTDELRKRTKVVE